MFIIVPTLPTPSQFPVPLKCTVSPILYSNLSPRVEWAISAVSLFTLDLSIHPFSPCLLLKNLASEVGGSAIPTYIQGRGVARNQVRGGGADKISKVSSKIFKFTCSANFFRVLPPPPKLTKGIAGVEFQSFLSLSLIKKRYFIF